MRIRQVKPAFWTDKDMSVLSYPARLYYIGLWCVADDAGWLEWDLDELGALLFPYESPARRRKHLVKWTDELVALAKVVPQECGRCAVIPSLDSHQKHAGGNRSYQYRDAHMRRHLSVSTDSSGQVPEKVAGRVGNGRVGNGTERNVIRDAREEDQDSEFRRKVPRPVVVA